jgi:uncharacterized protein
MFPVIPGSFTSIVVLVMMVLVLFAMRVVQPQWWHSRSARIGVLVTFGGMLIGLAVWTAGRATDNHSMVRAGAGAAYVGVLVFFPAALVMPVAAALDRVLTFVVRKRTPRAGTSSAPAAPAAIAATARSRISRRDVVRFGSASLPAMAALTGASGFVEAKRDASMPLIRLRYPNLHPDLEGFRILQLSDVHLGACLGIDDLVRGLAKARAQRPDLIVLTGDIADDISLIPEALRLVSEVGARYGAFASLGNHEYLHDITKTRPLYEASPIPLLVGSGRAIRVGRATLFVGGADDPVHMAGDIPWFLTPSIEAAAAIAPPHADFRLLLCHRPEGFGPATENGFDLSLAGHTHGGQLGMFGRSVLEKLKPGIGWWGTYSKKRPDPSERSSPSTPRNPGPGGASRLYTTSGFGHWFPFRLGCPTEMPLIVLEGGKDRPSGLPRV